VNQQLITNQPNPKMSAVKQEYLPSYTYADYEQWEGRWELIYGIPYAMSPLANWKHQRISHKIAWLLEESLKDCSFCKAFLPIDWKIDEETIVQSDNSVICGNPSVSKPYIEITPSLVFEILSPSTAKKDRTVKFDLYEFMAVKYYVIVNPLEDNVEIYELINGVYEKVLESNDESFTFDFERKGCQAAIDFGKIWE
jgi:Uma2 family endonuclease